MMRFVLNIIKLYIVFVFFRCFGKEGRVVENIESDVATLKILSTMQKS